MNARTIIVIIFAILCIVRLVFSINNDIYTNIFNCNNGICKHTAQSASGKIIQEKTINLTEFVSFSYEKNRSKSRKRHIVYNINGLKKDGTQVNITNILNKTPYERDNIIMQLNSLLNNESIKEITF